MSDIICVPLTVSRTGRREKRGDAEGSERGEREKDGEGGIKRGAGRRWQEDK